MTMKRLFYLSALCGILLSGGCTDENEAYPGSLPNPYNALAGDAKSYPACITVSYRVAADAVNDGYRYGVCWNTTGRPTIEDDYQYGPQKPSDGTALMQIIPNTRLKYGVTYHFRVFVIADSQVYYTDETTAALDGESLAPIDLEWTRQEFAGLPAGIEVYKTTSDLNGRKFQAWYAVADCSGEEVELRVQDPGNPNGVTVDGQFTDDCYVLINGGLFDFTTHVHDGIKVIDGVLTGTVYNPRGSWDAGDAEEYNRWYQVTRGIFGVDDSGKPAIFWAGTANERTSYYAHPLPSVRGEAQYAAVSNVLPTTPTEWAPRFAVGCGPVLMRGGECLIDGAVTEKGYQLTDYEIWTDGLALASYRADQTIVGYTADGKVILFICDGRVEGLSLGATHREACAILKSLGCVDALKLDGGGSTAMVVCKEHVNDLTGGNRPVATTLGFFKKQ